MVQWYFSPPTTEVTTPHQDRFWRRLKNPRSVSVLKQPSGAYVQVYEPSGEQIDGASAAYIGGHRYPVDETEAQSLREAGYDSYLTAES